MDTEKKAEIILVEQHTKIDQMPLFKHDIKLLSAEETEEYYMKRPMLFNKNRHGTLAILSEKLSYFLRKNF